MVSPEGEFVTNEVVDTDLTFPFARDAAFGQQDNVVNSRADRNGAVDLEHARHSVALHYPPISMGCDRRHIVSQENSLLFGCPNEECFIIDTGQANILRANYVDIGASAGVMRGE